MSTQNLAETKREEMRWRKGVREKEIKEDKDKKTEKRDKDIQRRGDIK
jgi:hypothetical protein